MIRGPGRLSYVGFSEETRASASSIVSRLVRLAWVEVDLWMLAPRAWQRWVLVIT